VRNDHETMGSRGRTVRTITTVFGLLVLASSPALARRHTIERGETLEHIARQYNCSVAEIQRANGIDTTLIRAGATLKIPTCRHGKGRIAAVDPGARKIKRERKPEPEKRVAIDVVEGQSVGEPWDGELHDGVRLHLGDGFLIRRPKRAWGASHVVTQVERALASIHDRFPNAHTLAIGDLSARDGGPISDHHSHQTGRDIDIGLYFTAVPEGYPESFAEANDDLDLKKTYYLLQAFAKTADQDTGVQKIYMDFALQGRLYKWAKAHDVPTGYLDELFQYPHGRGASEGLVRHEPNHDDHFHVRFKCAPDDDECE
jgi:murein endopeptidase